MQSPEQITRGKIDGLLTDAGWVLQSRDSFDRNAALGVGGPTQGALRSLYLSTCKTRPSARKSQKIWIHKRVTVGHTPCMKTKDAGPRIRVERQLRDEFLESCRLQDRPAAQMLREFMRHYVDRHRSLIPPTEPSPEGPHRKAPR